MLIVPKWSKDAKEFEVNVHYNDEKGTQVRIPKPILEKMHRPEKVKFVIKGKTIRIIPTNKSKKSREVKSSHGH